MTSPSAFSQRSATDRNTINKIDQEITQLEAQISQLSQQILSLKSTRDAHVSIAHLHHEILQEIFITTAFELGGTSGRMALLVSWICRSWRQIALQTPALWSCVDFKHPEWIQTAVSRTRDHELEFRLSLRLEDPFDHILRPTQENLYRIKRFDIHAFSGEISPEEFPCSPTWIMPAPCLVELSLTRIGLPQNLFAGTCPSLRSLSLSSCKFSWDSLPAHHGLTKFSVDTPSSKISVNDLVLKIQSIGPTLRHFQLAFALEPFLPQSEDSPPPRITLGHATSFTLTDWYGDAIAFLLNQVSLPKALEIDVEAFGGNLSEQFAVAQALVGARGLNEWPVTHLGVDYREDYFRFSMTEEWLKSMVVDGQDTAPTSARTSVKLALNNSRGDDLLPTFDTLPFSPVNSLHFRGGDYEHHEPAIFGYFSGQGIVQSLDIDLTFLPTFIVFIKDENRQLRQVTNIGTPDVAMVLDNQTIAAGLHAMGFHPVRRIRVDGDGSASDEFELGKKYYSELREWLVWRNLLGLRLDSLRFYKMDMQPSARALFQGLVTQLEFAGVEDANENSAMYNMDWPR